MECSETYKTNIPSLGRVASSHLNATFQRPIDGVLFSNKRVEWYPNDRAIGSVVWGSSETVKLDSTVIALPSASLNYMGDGCLVGGGNYSLQECPKKIPAFPYLQLMRAVFKVFILLYQLCWFMKTQSKRGSRSFWFIQYLVRNECSCFSSPRQVIRQDLFGAV